MKSLYLIIRLGQLSKDVFRLKRLRAQISLSLYLYLSRQIPLRSQLFLAGRPDLTWQWGGGDDVRWGRIRMCWWGSCFRHILSVLYRFYPHFCCGRKTFNPLTLPLTSANSSTNKHISRTMTGVYHSCMCGIHYSARRKEKKHLFSSKLYAV